MTLQDRPLVSVLIPVQDVQAYLLETLESIESQTYDNLEIVVVDDGSRDATPDVVAKFASRFPMTTVLLPERKGVCHALNVGLKACSGQYVARIDGDDIADRRRVELQLDFLRSNPRVHLVGCSFEQISETGDTLGFVHLPQSPLACRWTAMITTPVAHVWMAPMWVYQAVNGYSLVWPGEDYMFLWKMHNRGLRFANLPDYFGMKVRVRRRGSSSADALWKYRRSQVIRTAFRSRKHTEADLLLLDAPTADEESAYQAALKSADRLRKPFGLKDVIEFARGAFRSPEYRSALALRVFVRLLFAFCAVAAGVSKRLASPS